MIHDIIKYGLLGIGGTLVTSFVIEEQMKNYDTVIEPPVDSVSIIMPSFNEEAFVEESCKSIRNQSIIQKYPQYFEFIIVDSNSSDRTVELARPYVDKVIIAGRGKLTARNLATDMAKGNIIVSVDSDSKYGNGWLNTLLKPFKNPEIVATSGSTIDYGIPFIPGQIHSILSIFHKNVFYPNQLYGRNCAYRKDIFYKIGKFTEKINQQNLQEMLFEEETEFGNRMAQYGKVEYILNAGCEHLGGKRVSCRMGIQKEDYKECKDIGINRF